jgi:23S rRNA (adenine-N6)-dimethyltransferase
MAARLRRWLASRWFVAVDNSRLAWGWHQLDPRWAERIVAEAGVGRGALVLDVGAGLGALAEPLMAAGARVIAIECHPGRAAQLRRRFGRELTVVQADGADLRLPRRPFHVVANPPFAITSALLHRLLHSGSRLVSAHIVLQDQVVRRWAGPDAPKAHRWTRTFVVGAGRPLPRSAFHPPPSVSCRLLVIRRR